MKTPNKLIERYIICSMDFSYDRLSTEEIETIRGTYGFQRRYANYELSIAISNFKEEIKKDKMLNFMYNLLLKSVGILNKILEKIGH